MKFIKALQKSNGTTPKPKQKVVQSDAGGEAKISRLVPGLMSDEGLKIGVAAPVAETEFGPNVTGDGFDGSLEVPDEITFREVAEPHATLLVDPQRVNRHLVAITDPKSVFAEEYRDLRTSLLQKGKKQKLQTIAIASVAPGEGKSVTALNLAWLLAQTEGVNALVIDGDMRRPSLSRYLGIDEGPGLSELLDGDVRLSDVLVRLEPSGLHLLPGGRPRSDVAEQISGPNFANILGQLQASFDFVIIDAPPLGV